MIPPDMPDMRLDTYDPIEARVAALEDDDEGLAYTILVEPLTALAGGIIGAVTVVVVAWHLTWRHHRLDHPDMCVSPSRHHRR